jgi:hypothetical protein
MNQTLSQQADVESVLRRAHVEQSLLGREQVEEQCRQSSIIQLTRDELIAPTVPTAAASVNKKHQRGCLVRND